MIVSPLRYKVQPLSFKIVVMARIWAYKPSIKVVYSLWMLMALNIMRMSKKLNGTNVFLRCPSSLIFHQWDFLGGVGSNLKMFQADKLLRPYPPLLYTQDAALVYLYLLSC